MEQVIAGRDVDLLDEFGDKEEKRVLSSTFLQKLLTDSIKGIKVKREAIRIMNAAVIESGDVAKLIQCCSS